VATPHRDRRRPGGAKESEQRAAGSPLALDGGGGRGGRGGCGDGASAERAGEASGRARIEGPVREEAEDAMRLAWR